MPGLNFSGANLAVVAYAEVSGAAGASTVTNSGIATTRISLGLYQAILPAGLTQNSGRDLIFVQPKGTGGSLVAKMAVVDDTLDATKLIAIFDGNPALGASTGIDSDFSLLILRTTITPPAGAPA